MRIKLMEARIEAGYKTHDEIAKVLDISRPHYTHLELGTRNPTINLAIRISKLLNKTLDEIFLPNDVSERDQEEPPSANAAG